MCRKGHRREVYGWIGVDCRFLVFGIVYVGVQVYFRGITFLLDRTPLSLSMHMLQLLFSLCLVVLLLFAWINEKFRIFFKQPCACRNVTVEHFSHESYSLNYLYLKDIRCSASENGKVPAFEQCE